MEEFTEQLDAVNPPEEVADWHAAVLVYQRAVKEALDDAPGPGEGVSEDAYIISVLFPVGLQHQPDITEAIKGMDPDLIARMIEAGCIDADILSMSLTPEEMKALGVSPGGTAGGKVITEFVSISAGDMITPAVWGSTAPSAAGVSTISTNPHRLTACSSPSTPDGHIPAV